MEGKSQEKSHKLLGPRMSQKSRKGEQKLAQQKKLIFKIDLVQYSVSHQLRKNSCSKQLCKMYKTS